MISCPNCKAQIDDQQQFCPNCGMKLEQNEQTPKSKNGRKFAVIAVITVVLIVAITAAALVFTWYNSDEKQVMRALEAGEYKTVLEIMEENRSLRVNDELEKLLSERLSELKEEFTANNLTYAKITDELDTIEQMEVRAVSGELANVRDYAAALNESRTNFSTAEEFFAKGDYPEAMKYYRLVTNADSNYDAARTRLTEAQDKYRQNKLGEASALADSGDYTGAVVILRDALTVLPGDSNLTQQVTVYEKANVDQIKNNALSSAATYAESGDYLGAIAVLEAYLETNPGDATITNKISEYETAYQQKQKEEALTMAAQYAETEDYASAISVLQNYLDTVADDADVSRQLTVYITANIDMIRKNALVEAADYASYGDYLSAMNVLQNYIDTYGTHADVTVANNGYKESYVTSVIAEADEAVDHYGYAVAMGLIRDAKRYVSDKRFNVQYNNYAAALKESAITNADGLATSGKYLDAIQEIELVADIIGEDTELIQKIEEYQMMYVRDVCEEADELIAMEKYDEAITIVNNALGVVTGNAKLEEKLNKINGIRAQNLVDILNPFLSNDYEVFKEGNSAMMGGMARYNGFMLNVYGWNGQSCAVYNLDRCYTKLTGLIGYVDDRIGNGGTWEIQIYADDILALTIAVKPGDLPQEFSIDLTGVTKLEFRTPDGHGYNAHIGFAELKITGSADDVTSELPDSEMNDGNYLVDTIDPFLSNDYEVFKEGNSAMMGGMARYNGFMLNVYGWNGQSCAVYNLDRCYTKLTGLIGYVDDRIGNGGTWEIQIYADDILALTIAVKPGDLPQEFSIDLTGVTKLEFRTPDGHGYNAHIGFAELNLS